MGEFDVYAGVLSADQKKRARAPMMKRLGLALAALLVVLAAVAAWYFMRPVEIDSYADSAIELVGLADDTITITPAEIAQLNCERAGASGSSRKAGTVVGYGPKLSTLLGHYGYSLSDLKKLRITCKDDYYQIINQDNLQSLDVYLSIGQGISGKDPLYEKAQPARLVIPGGDSALWAYGISKLEFVFTWTPDDASHARKPSRTPQSELEESSE